MGIRSKAAIGSRPSKERGHQSRQKIKSHRLDKPQGSVPLRHGCLKSADEDGRLWPSSSFINCFSLEKAQSMTFRIWHEWLHYSVSVLCCLVTASIGRSCRSQVIEHASWKVVACGYRLCRPEKAHRNSACFTLHASHIIGRNEHLSLRCITLVDHPHRCVTFCRQQLIKSSSQSISVLF